jgi:hypothetical protein
MQYLRIFVENLAYAMATVITHDRATPPFCILLYGMADITQA